MQLLCCVMGICVGKTLSTKVEVRYEPGKRFRVMFASLLVFAHSSAQAQANS